MNLSGTWAFGLFPVFFRASGADDIEDRKKLEKSPKKGLRGLPGLEALHRPQGMGTLAAALGGEDHISAPGLNISFLPDVLPGVKKYRWFRTALNGSLQDALHELVLMWDQIAGGVQQCFRTEFPTEVETLASLQRDFPRLCRLFLLHSLEDKVLARLKTLHHGNRLLLGLLPPERPHGTDLRSCRETCTLACRP